MSNSNERTNPEEHPYIDLHSKNPQEIDPNIGIPDEDPFWHPENVDRGQVVWRYMDLEKFISILKDEAIWFSHYSKFEDPYEGRYSQATAERIMREYSNFSLQDINSIEDVIDMGVDHYVSCWNLKDRQSAALWKMYVEGSKGVAIKTTVGNLLGSLDYENQELRQLEITTGKVKYHTEGEEPRGRYAPIFTKRDIFDFENEYRLVVTGPGPTNDNIGGENTHSEREPPNLGLAIPIDTNQLIDELYISPSSASYVWDIVEDLKKKYNTNFSIEKSTLYTHPVFDD